MKPGVRATGFASALFLESAAGMESDPLFGHIQNSELNNHRSLMQMAGLGQEFREQTHNTELGYGGIPLAQPLKIVQDSPVYSDDSIPCLRNNGQIDYRHSKEINRGFTTISPRVINPSVINSLDSKVNGGHDLDKPPTSFNKNNDSINGVINDVINGDDQRSFEGIQHAKECNDDLARVRMENELLRQERSQIRNRISQNNVTVTGVVSSMHSHVRAHELRIHELETRVTCPICKRIDFPRDQVLIPCGHFICSRCLEAPRAKHSLMPNSTPEEKNIFCPICKIECTSVQPITF